MLDWSFELNNKPISTFKCGAFSFPAFSGRGQHVNRRVSACIPNNGPIPPGSYYIFDRQSGGVLGAFYDMFGRHSNWFALYPIDKYIDDDEMFCEKVKRGQFRLHPKEGIGISQGCITIESHIDYQRLRAMLKNTKQQAVPGSKLLAYGKVVVK